MLLVRPKPSPWECLPDYSGRLADANGLQGGWEIHRALTAGGAEAQSLLGDSANTLQTTMLGVSNVEVQWRGIHYPRYDFLLTQAPYCPECLKESGLRPIYWRSRWSVACATHQRQLVALCPACKEPPTTPTSGAVRCSCGNDLRRASPAGTAVPAEVSAAQRLLDATFVASPACTPELVGHPAWDVLSAPGGRTTFQWLLRILPNLAAPRKSSLAVHLPERYEEVRSLAPIIAGWPASLEDVLREAWTRYYDIRRRRQLGEADSLYRRLRGFHDACDRMTADGGAKALATKMFFEPSSSLLKVLDSETTARAMDNMLAPSAGEHESLGRVRSGRRATLETRSCRPGC